MNQKQIQLINETVKLLELAAANLRVVNCDATAVESLVILPIIGKTCEAKNTLEALRIAIKHDVYDAGLLVK